MLIDSHIHLYAAEYDPDRDLVMRMANDAGVTKFLLPNIDGGSVIPMLELCKAYPGECYPMIGLHPCSVDVNYEQQLDNLLHIFQEQRTKFIAIGEIGLDFHWDITFRSQQEEAFRIQVVWASENNLPIVIHSRESVEAIIEILRKLDISTHRGVFHCFSGSSKQAEEITAMGYMLGIGGVVTFKNSGLDKILPGVSMDSIILETDGPYLAPEPFRGKRNEPGNLKIIAARVADIKGLTFDEVMLQTTSNAMQLFQLSNY